MNANADRSLRSLIRLAAIGAVCGALGGFIVHDLELASALLSYWGPSSPLVLLAAVVGAALWVTKFRLLVTMGVGGLAILWLAVMFTPLSRWLHEDLPRRDPLKPSPAVFVFASGLQADGDLTESSMARLLTGLEVVASGYADTLVLAELPPPEPSFEKAAQGVIERLNLILPVETVGPVENSHDEAVAVADLYKARRWERLIAVTSPSHTRRAAAALEAQGVNVLSHPSYQPQFDRETLKDPDVRLRAFSAALHEWLGIWVYRQRGWIPGRTRE